MRKTRRYGPRGQGDPATHCQAQNCTSTWSHVLKRARHPAPTRGAPECTPSPAEHSPCLAGPSRSPADRHMSVPNAAPCWPLRALRVAGESSQWCRADDLASVGECVRKQAGVLGLLSHFQQRRCHIFVCFIIYFLFYLLYLLFMKCVPFSLIKTSFTSRVCN